MQELTELLNTLENDPLNSELCRETVKCAEKTLINNVFLSFRYRDREDLNDQVIDIVKKVLREEIDAGLADRIKKMVINHDPEGLERETRRIRTKVVCSEVFENFWISHCESLGKDIVYNDLLDATLTKTAWNNEPIWKQGDAYFAGPPGTHDGFTAMRRENAI